MRCIGRVLYVSRRASQPGTPPLSLPPQETVVETVPVSGSSNGVNALGMVVFSICLGLVMGSMKQQGQALRDFFDSLNEAIMRLVAVIIWSAGESACTRTHVHTGTRTYTACMHAHARTHTHTHKHTRMHTHVCTHIHSTYIGTHTHSVNYRIGPNIRRP